MRPRRGSICAENLRSRATLYDRSPNELAMHFIDWGSIGPGHAFHPAEPNIAGRQNAGFTGSERGVHGPDHRLGGFDAVPACGFGPAQCGVSAGQQLLQVG